MIWISIKGFITMPYPNSTQKLSWYLEGNFRWHLWKKVLWQLDYHAALWVNISPSPSPSLYSQTASCNFLREDSGSVAMWDDSIHSQRQWHISDLFWTTKCGNNPQQENMCFTFKSREAQVVQLFTTQDAKKKNKSLTSSVVTESQKYSCL